MTPAVTGSLSWIVTDGQGRIDALSRSAAMLLGLRTTVTERNLLHFFPRDRRGLTVDIDIALTGWPSVRTVVLSPIESRPVVVRYLVSRRVVHDAVELYWTLEVVDTDYAAAS